MSEKTPTELAVWIKGIIKGYLDQSPENTLQNEANEKAFEEALVGFARGDDPIFEEFKEHVGPFHWTPQEIFTMTFPEVSVKADELSVISYVLLQTEATKADNRKETAFPAERWARARIMGEQVNVNLRKLVVAALQGEGYEAVAPTLTPEWKTEPSDRYVIASRWSERHAAYASGLGTFGLCDGLITPKGKAMRVGTAVARIPLPPSPRPYTDHHAYCLFFSKGICGKCIPRCPADALSRKGHDKKACRSYIRPVTSDYVKAKFGFEGYGCGLCQTKVPCESKIPREQDVNMFESL